MAIWLAIDTATRAGQIALDINGSIIERVLPAQERHDVALVAALDGLLREHHLQPNNLSHIVVNRGPGSFTALRIGLMTANTLAQALDAEVIGIGALHELATWGVEQLGLTAGACTAIADSGRGKVFAQHFSIQPAATHNDCGGCMPVEPASSALELSCDDLVPLSEAGVVVAAGLSPVVSNRLIELGVDVRQVGQPRARVLLDLARSEAGCWPVLPLYVRRPEAEEKHGPI